MPGNYLPAIMLEINNYLNCLSRQELSGMVCWSFAAGTIGIEVLCVLRSVQLVCACYTWWGQ